MGKEEAEAVRKVLESGWLVEGPVTRELEEEFCKLVGTKHAVAVANCTCALFLALKALGIGPGDEVIVPSMTFVATAEAVVAVGARPVFADIIDVLEPNIDPEDVRRKITERTKAIIVVHYAGFACRMEEIMDVAERYGLYVVEDCAHAPGAEYKGRRLGSIGHVGCFSFFANKNICAGEGGMLTTNDDRIAEKVRLLKTHGMTVSSAERYRKGVDEYDVVLRGHNMRMDDIRSAIALVQLRKLDRDINERKKIWEIYEWELRKGGVRLPFGGFVHRASRYILPVLLPQGVERGLVVKKLREKGIQTSWHYKPVHWLSAYRDLAGGSLPRTDEYGKREITLPFYPTMVEGDVREVVRCLFGALGL